ncbi:MAG: adenosylmethionine decarboxylase [Verrucomicrobiota bacterium]
MKSLGHHTLIEFTGCDPGRIDSARRVRRHLLEAAVRARGTVVKAVFHTFSPWGVSGVVVISESHLTVHTWPEHGYAAVDVFSCGRRLRHAVVRDYLREAFGATGVESRRIERGRGLVKRLKAKPNILVRPGGRASKARAPRQPSAKVTP